jgi:hypothetical protein
MANCPITRRTTTLAVAGIAAAALGFGPVQAADKTVTVGLNLSLTGAQAASAKIVEYGVMMAFDEINAQGGVNGYTLVLRPYDDGTATAGQYERCQGIGALTLAAASGTRPSCGLGMSSSSVPGSWPWHKTQ